MHDIAPPAATHPVAMATRTASRLVVALLPALLLAACSGPDDAVAAGTGSLGAASQEQAVADTGTFDAGLEEGACSLLPPALVASVFDVPADALERGSSMQSKCAYSWESDGRTVEASLKVSDVHDDAEDASRQFRSVTRGMSGEALDRAKQQIADKANEQLQTAGQKKAAGAVVSTASGSKGIVFEDVEGIGDEARMAQTVGAGDLHVRVGNMHLVVAAYSGPGMPRLEKLTGGSMLAAHKAWRVETWPARKQAATELARVVVESL